MTIKKDNFIKNAMIGCTAALLPALSQHAFSESTSTLEEIIVSARKTQESMQRTPISVAAFTAADLEQKSISNISTMDAFIPNVTIGTSPNKGGYGTFSIRGIGGGSGQVYEESGVGLYIDDIYYPRSTGALLDVIDVEQIEVLRGPQGTLFGRNTTGGAIRYITAKPEDEFKGKITGSIGNYDRRDVSASINIPLTETLKSRFTLASKQSDGFVKRLNDGIKMGNIDVAAARGQLRWTPTDSLDINLAIDTIDSRNDGIPRDIPIINPTDTAPTRVGDPNFTADLATPDRYTVAGGERPDINDLESTGTTLTATYDINTNVQLKSLTGYRDSTSRNLNDWDLTESAIWLNDQHTDFSTFSQEIQLSGATDGSGIKWLVGLYYMNEDATLNNFREGGLYGANGVLETVDIDTTSQAIFTQATFQLLEDLSMTLGIRWSEDEKEVISSYGAIGNQLTGSNDDSWSSVTPRIGFEYQFNDDVMAYISAAKGFQAGGFNTRPRNGAPNGGIIAYDPENLWTYEIGLRSEFMDNRVRLNTTYFTTDYKDIQTSSLVFAPITNVPIQVTQNSAKASAQGVEIDLQALLTDNWSINISGGWIDAEYDDVTGSTSLTLDTPFQFTPEYSYVIATNYDAPLADGSSVNFNLNYGWKDKQLSTNSGSNGFFLPSYGLLNGRITYSAPTGNWSVALFGTNLLDEEYLTGAFDGSTQEHVTGFVQHDLGRPREIGVELSVEF